MDKKHVKKIADIEAKKAVKGHEAKMHAKGYKKGGPTSDDMVRVGRNLARAKNQGA